MWAWPGFAYAFGRRLGPAAALIGALNRVHPGEPHWYLHAIGVDPVRQGSGVGGSLPRSRLRRSDESGVPVMTAMWRPRA